MSETRVPPSFNGDELLFQVGLADNSDISEKNTKARARNTGDIRFMTDLLLFHFHRLCLWLILIDAIKTDSFTVPPMLMPRYTYTGANRVPVVC